MNMRNATCVGTQTSKVPTRVTLLFIPYTVIRAMLFNRFWPIVLRRYVFKRRRALKDLSAEQDVARIAARIENTFYTSGRTS